MWYSDYEPWTMSYMIPWQVLYSHVCTLGQVTQSDSIFTYETGQSVDTFSFPDHAPPFLDEILSNLIGNSSLTDVCGNNVECLFDFSQTGDMEVGMAAISVENETATENQEACK